MLHMFICENPNGVMNTISMSDEYGLRIGKINRMILGDDPQWNYAKLLKKGNVCKQLL